MAATPAADAEGLETRSFERNFELANQAIDDRLLETRRQISHTLRREVGRRSVGQLTRTEHFVSHGGLQAAETEGDSRRVIQ